MPTFKQIANAFLRLWLGLLLIYPVTYLGVVKLTRTTLLWKIAMLHVGLAPWSLGIFGTIILLFWWGTHLRKNWLDLLTFMGLLFLGITVLFGAMILLAPFTP